jgi:hypothetical protein
VFVLRGFGLNVVDLFVDVSLHPSAQRRVKLREVANLQETAERRLAIADFREAFMIPTISFASDVIVIRQSTFGDRQLQSLLDPAQIFLRLDCRSAAGAGGGHRLFVNAIRHIARNENARVFALGQVPDQ